MATVDDNLFRRSETFFFTHNCINTDRSACRCLLGDAPSVIIRKHHILNTFPLLVNSDIYRYILFLMWAWTMCVSVNRKEKSHDSRSMSVLFAGLTNYLEFYWLVRV